MAETSCQYSKIYVIQSLSADEPRTGANLVSALEASLKPVGVGIELCDVATVASSSDG